MTLRHCMFIHRVVSSYNIVNHLFLFFFLQLFVVVTAVIIYTSLYNTIFKGGHLIYDVLAKPNIHNQQASRSTSFPHSDAPKDTFCSAHRRQQS